MICGRKISMFDIKIHKIWEVIYTIVLILEYVPLICKGL